MKNFCLYLLTVLMCGSAYGTERIDITGNWRTGSSFNSKIQVSEPALKKGETCCFLQTLTLPKGNYTLSVSFSNSELKLIDSAIIQGLKLNGKAIRLTFSRYSAMCSFNISAKQEEINLQLNIASTRPPISVIERNEPFSISNTPFFAIQPESKGETVFAHGIPFIVNNLHYADVGFGINEGIHQPLRPWQNGMVLNCGNTPVQKAYFLGMIHNTDIANGSWNSRKGDNSYSHFVGDTAGYVVINYTDRIKFQFPLVFGFNLWYSRPWDILWFDTFGENTDSQLFGGNNSFRQIIANNLCLADGVRPFDGKSGNARFVFALDLQGKKVESIEVKGDKQMAGFPLISAVTIQTDQPAQSLIPLPELTTKQSGIAAVSPEYISGKKWLPGNDSMKHLLYTFVDEYPKLTKPVIPKGYFGPSYDFRGRPEAVYAATYLYRNGPECASYIADNGCTCQSPTAINNTYHYSLGIGIWRAKQPLFGSLQNWFSLYQNRIPGEMPGLGSAWSRSIGELLREAMASGYDKFAATSYVDWLDSCLIHDGNPPHWIRQAGWFDEQFPDRKVGNVIEKGNRENDGHGICMWGRYMVWHWLGKPVEWNMRHFNATEAAVDWIQWQLDTDTIFPGKRKDVLYTESECAHNNYEIYSSYNCLHGLRLSIAMAKQMGRNDLVEKWQKLYLRLQKGILDNLTIQSEFGPIWFTDPKTDWQDHAQMLVHIQLAPDGITYTPLQDYAKAGGEEKKYLEIDRNSYRFLMKSKNYNCLRMFGYGQGMMTQSALLLDQMDDATQFINTMVTHCYQPHLDGWAGPEGIILHKSGKYYVPVNGYMGQDSHVADSHKALRLMIGIDDNDPDHLKLVPRFPVAWDTVSVGSMPVLTGKKRQNMAYTYIRNKEKQVFEYTFDSPLNIFDVRLGPIPVGKTVKNVFLNGTAVSFEKLHSGDSDWICMKELNGLKGKIELGFE